MKICSLYFGVHPTQIQEDLIFLATKKIINEFNQISIEELVHAYDRIEIQRQVTLTIEDLIQPVKKYIFAKNYISAEQEKIQKQEIEEQIAEQKKIEHLKTCVLRYEESLKAGKWLGNIFEAITTAKEFNLKQYLSKEQTLLFWNEAKNEYFELKKQEKEDEKNELQNFLSNLGKTAERIYAEKIVVECIKQKIKLK